MTTKSPAHHDLICKRQAATEHLARPRASPFGRNQKIKDRLLRIRRIVFRLRLSFHRLSFLRRRRKADYGEKQKAKSSFLNEEPCSKLQGIEVPLRIALTASNLLLVFLVFLYSFLPSSSYHVHQPWLHNSHLSKILHPTIPS